MTFIALPYCATNGRMAMTRARFTATVRARWWLAQLPLMRRGRILPRSEMYLRRRVWSL
jgi:hypothetical protein